MLDQRLNAFVLGRIRRFLCLWHNARARRAGKAFYCNALNGTSDYNISVNCDMTVSCSCADHDGSGTIGDLSSQTLKEIFDGPRAQAFRQSMARGRLAIPQCATCPEVRRLERSKAAHYLAHYSLPTKGIMVENTIHCNYNCRSCSRSLITAKRKKKSLTLDDVKKISLMIHEHSIASLYYFKLGEIFLCPTIYEEVSTIRNDNPGLEIKVETNGSLINTDKKREAAMLMNRVRVSIDGTSDRVLARYQRGGSFRTSYDNIRNLVAYRNARGRKLPHIEWKYVVFNWNDREKYLADAIRLAREAGVDGISFWPTVSPFYGFSLRYHFRLYSDKIRPLETDRFFVRLRTLGAA